MKMRFLPSESDFRDHFDRNFHRREVVLCVSTILRIGTGTQKSTKLKTLILLPNYYKCDLQSVWRVE